MTVPLPEPGIPETELVPPPDQSDPMAMAQYLGAALVRLTKQLKTATVDSEARDAKLDRYARRSRLYIALDVLLTVVSAVATVLALSALGSADSANSRATSANARVAAATAVEQAQHASEISGCVSGNQYRVGVVASLDRLVLLLEGPHPSPVVRKAAVGYERYVLSQNEPRNCQLAYSIKPQPKETDGTAK